MGKQTPKTGYDAAYVMTLEASVQELRDENERLRQKLERMNELLLNAQRVRFGQSSEKRAYVMAEGEQLRMFNEAEAAQDVKAPEPTEETFTVQEHTRKKKRTAEELTENLPVKEIILELPEAQRQCKCGAQMTPIGKKYIRQELEIIPKQIYRVQYYSVTYVCKECEQKTGETRVAQVAPPRPLLKHSLASPSAVADVMTQKYVDGIPLARQEKIWKRDGIELSRATMANWVIQCTQTWLKPIYRQLRKTLLEQSVIHADETVVQVLKEEGKPAASESRMWLYASGQRSRKQIRYFEYQPNRSGRHPAALLKDFRGCLVTDGYAGYDKVPYAVRCGCWAHMRRKWREAMPRGATMKTSQAAIGYNYCSKLFSLEKKYSGMNSENRKFARQAEAEPLLEAYWLWLKSLDPVPGSKLDDAVTYANNQRPYLCAFLEHGEVDISNNLAENAIRPFVIGRKNWLFSDTPKGADSSAVIYSLVESAKVNDLEPRSYLWFLLDEMRYLDKSPSAAELDTLLPWSPGIRKLLEKEYT